MHFSYQQSQREALVDIRNLLEEQGFSIIKYAPEDGFILTDYKEFNWGTGRRLLAVTVHIHDKVTITGMGKIEIPTSGIGDPEDMLRMKSMDKLPYNIQKRIFLPLGDKLDSLGYKKLKHWP